MKLETRVEQLEHELKILKNEIQGTLLDIQEQILIHYYPTLRGDDSEPTDALSGLVDAVRSGRKPIPERQPRPITSFRLDEVDLDEDDDEVHLPPPTSLPQHRNGASRTGASKLPRRERDFSLDNLEDEEDEEIDTPRSPARPKSQENGPADARRSGRKLPPPHGKEAAGSKRQPQPARANFAALAEWAGESVGRLGKERAKKTVETYANGGYLAVETKEMLLQLIALAEEEEPTQPPTTKDSMELMVKLDQVLGSQ